MICAQNNRRMRELITRLLVDFKRDRQNAGYRLSPMSILWTFSLLFTPEGQKKSELINT